MVSYDRFLEFVKRSNAISPTITMETATALQVTKNYIFYL
jgi:vacuolar protein sorting-associated protein 13A/C